MKCFNHDSYDAVAVCKACGRALCRECVVEVGRSCSCMDRCESTVEIHNDLIERGRTAYQKNSSTFFRNGVIIIILAVVFVTVGTLLFASGADSGLLLVVMGTLFGGLGISNLISARGMAKK